MPNHPAKRNDKFKGIKTGGWTKYAGARFGLVQSKPDDIWYCQACRHEQPGSLPAFLLEINPKEKEFVRVCSNCFHLARQNGYSYHKVSLIVRYDN